MFEVYAAGPRGPTTRDLQAILAGRPRTGTAHRKDSAHVTDDVPGTRALGSCRRRGARIAGRRKRRSVDRPRTELRLAGLQPAIPSVERSGLLHAQPGWVLRGSRRRVGALRRVRTARQ